MMSAVTSPHLQALRDAGAAHFDPIAWHYIEVLANRVQSLNGPAQQLLQLQLDKALGDLQARMNRAPSPDAARVAEPSVASPLAQLLQSWPGVPSALTTEDTKSQSWQVESARMQQFRKTLSTLRAHKQVSHAIAQAPNNAGPINSHMLVLRALGQMRELSPDYLSRFINYVDTLRCLDEAGKGKPAHPTKSPKTKSPKSPPQLLP